MFFSKAKKHDQSEDPASNFEDIFDEINALVKNVIKDNQYDDNDIQYIQCDDSDREIDDTDCIFNNDCFHGDDAKIVETSVDDSNSSSMAMSSDLKLAIAMQSEEIEQLEQLARDEQIARSMHQRYEYEAADDKAFSSGRSVRSKFIYTSLAAAVGDEKVRATDISKATFECKVCLDDQISLDHATSACESCGFEACFSCLRMHIIGKLQDRILPQCPRPGNCKQFISHHVVLSLLRNNHERNMFTAALQRSLEESPGLTFCTVPDCNGCVDMSAVRPRDGDIDGNIGSNVDNQSDNTSNNNHIFVCPVNPSHVRCLNCSRLGLSTDSIHDGNFNMSCTEYLKRMRMNLKIDKVRGTIWEKICQRQVRLCPQCGNGIEKNGGCSSMRCRCGYRFNWERV